MHSISSISRLNSCRGMIPRREGGEKVGHSTVPDSLAVLGCRGCGSAGHPLRGCPNPLPSPPPCMHPWETSPVSPSLPAEALPGWRGNSRPSPTTGLPSSPGRGFGFLAPGAACAERPAPRPAGPALPCSAPPERAPCAPVGKRVCECGVGETGRGCLSRPPSRFRPARPERRVGRQVRAARRAALSRGGAAPARRACSRLSGTPL